MYALFVLLGMLLGCTPSLEGDGNPAEFANCNQKIGSHPCDFSLSDQNGQEWNLYDHYGTTMVLDFSTMWCGPCQIAAQSVAEHQRYYSSQGHEFLWVTILIDDIMGESVTVDEAKLWADTFEIIDSPVLVGNRSFQDETEQYGFYLTSWPTFYIIDDEMTVKTWVKGWGEETVLQQVELALGTE